MKRSLLAAVLVLALTVCSSAAYGQGPELSGEMKARKIVMSEDNRDIAVPADQVFPLDMVEYTLRYRNTGNASATGINLTGPIPEGTVYLDRTATGIEGARPRFSIDGGKTYQESPVTYTFLNKKGEEETREATPDMITHVQWHMEGDLEAGQDVVVSYRVQVK